MSVRMYLDGMPELISKLSPAKVTPILRRYLTKSAILIQRSARTNAPKFQGTLAKSIVYEIDARSATIGTNLIYAAATEFGRPRGAKAPPPGSLLPWMARKGIPAAMEYPLAQSIAHNGTKPQPYLGPAVQQNQNAILGAMLDDVAKQIEAVMAT